MDIELQPLATVAGTVGGMLSIGAFLPQAYRIIQRRSAMDVSLSMYLTIVAGCLLWMFYAYVHESVAEKFVAEAKSALIALYGKDPRNNPDYSRVINAREVSRLAGLLDPTKVIAGGKSDPDASYLDPTLVYPVRWGDPCQVHAHI